VGGKDVPAKEGVIPAGGRKAPVKALKPLKPLKKKAPGSGGLPVCLSATSRSRGDVQVSLLTLKDRLLLQYDPGNFLWDMLKIGQYTSVRFKGYRIPPAAGTPVDPPDAVQQPPIPLKDHSQPVGLSKLYLTVRRELIVLDQAPDQLHIEIKRPLFGLFTMGTKVTVVGLLHCAGIGPETFVVDGDEAVNLRNEKIVRCLHNLGFMFLKGRY
jgi:hypothetical protein